MRLAVLSDIHGNLPALEAVLSELEREQVQEFVCLGDVALGPQPRETMARVSRLGCPVVMGNWDAWALDGFPPAQEDPWRKFIEQGEWWARKLSAEDRAFLRTFVPQIELRLDGVAALCFHGSPRSYDDFILATTPHEELLRMLGGFGHPLMLGGHSHVQLVRVVEGILLVNPGSVGLPFRGLPAGRLQLISPWAEYAVVRVEDGQLSVDLRRAAYDVKGMLQRTIDSGVPHAQWWAETWGRDDPSDERDFRQLAARRRRTEAGSRLPRVRGDQAVGPAKWRELALLLRSDIYARLVKRAVSAAFGHGLGTRRRVDRCSTKSYCPRAGIASSSNARSL